MLISTNKLYINIENEEVHVSVKIRLKRFGSKKRPYYRIVAMDTRTARDGQAIEELGYYHPIEAEDKQLILKEDKIKAWLQKGALPSPTVRKLLNKNQITIK
jgi:small subunit ribosomal protein S16